MRSTDEEKLIRLAEAICDGEPVDWEREASGLPEARPVLDDLQKLEALAAALRGEPSEEDGAASGFTEPAPARTRWGTLILVERIGEGGFGEVFRAFDPDLQREVALKLQRAERVLEDDEQERFLEEARRLARVRHAHVVIVHGAARHDGRLGIWTDLVEGETLERLLTRSGPFGAREAAGIGVDLCRALAAVHQLGLIHRDVKTTNVMRENGGRIVLMDFGSARDLLRSPGRAEPQTGTPLAMAPEQLEGGDVSPATDLYSLAVILFRLVTGRFPYEADDLEALRAKQRRGEALSLRDLRPDLPGDFVKVIERGLETEPSRRFATAGAMERALLDLGGGAQASREGEGTSRRRTWVQAAIVTALAAIAVLLTARGIDRSSRPRPGVDAARPSASMQPAAPVVGRSAPLVTSVALLREDEQGTTTLVSGGTVSPGDAVYLNVRTRTPVHVYVLNEDAKGNIVVLFPIRGLLPANPLRSDVTHRLPGSLAGESLDWQVTNDGGGRETIALVASPQPLAAFEREIAKFPPAAAGAPIQYGQLSEDALATMRGFGGLVPSRVEAARAGRLGAWVRRVAARSDTSAVPWVWMIELRNEG